MNHPLWLRCQLYIVVSVLGTMLAAGPAFAWHAGLPPGATGPNLEEVRKMLRAGKRRASIRAIEHFVPFLKGSALNDALFLSGKAMVLTGDPLAVHALAKLPSPFKQAENRRLFWLTRAYTLTGDVERAERALTDYRPHETRNIEDVRLRLDVAELIGKKRSYVAANELLNDLKPRNLGRDEAARVKRIIALSKPQGMEQETLLRALRISHPTLPLKQNEVLRSAERFKRAGRLAGEWMYEEALRDYEKLFKKPYRKHACAWRMAVILQSKLRRSPERVRTLLTPFVSDSSHKHHEEALFRTIRAFINEDRYDDALQLIDRYDDAFPAGKYRESTAYYRGWLPYDSNRCTKGLPALRAYTKTFTKRRRHVRGFIAWCHIRKARWKSAIRGFAPLLREKDSMHRGKALYWQAYAHRKLGDEAKTSERLRSLEEDYPLSYYAFLGQQLRATMENRSTQASLVPWATSEESEIALDARCWTWPKVSGAMKRKLKRVRRLSELGELTHARAMYLPIREQVEKSVVPAKRHLFMVFIARAIEDFNRGYRATGIKRGSSKGMTPKRGEPRWHAAFPRAYRSLVEHLGDEASILPLFVYSIMRAESAYMASAVSHAEAVGALQMIRPTALKVAEEIGAVFDPRTFQDPRVGFRYSVHYMQKHLRLWKGHYLLAAASYNAGPSPVAKWVKTHQGRGLPFVVEEFKYNETRTYARRVAEYLLRYLALYPVSNQERGEILDALFPAEFKLRVPTDVGY
jgi:soluble lytic murein transglycosylase-like protein